MSAVLSVEGLRAGYGASVVVEDVSFRLAPGQSLALLGRNGTGKTTLLLALMGLARRHAGAIRWRGADISGWPPHRRAQAGIGWVPQERHVFPSLTVEEHLGASARPGPWTGRRVLDAFPALAQRRRHTGRQLSGGERQMLAIGRALVLNPDLLLLDEPMEGLAPAVVEELRALIQALLQDRTLAVVLVEQHVRMALAITQQAIVLDRGRIAHRAASADLAADAATLHRLLALA